MKLFKVILQILVTLIGIVLVEVTSNGKLDGTILTVLVVVIVIYVIRYLNKNGDKS